MPAAGFLLNRKETPPDIRTGSFQAWAWPGVWIAVFLLALVLDQVLPNSLRLPSGYTVFQLLMYLALVVAGVEFLASLTRYFLRKQDKPPGEAVMLTRLYHLLTGMAVLFITALGFGKGAAFASFFTLFGGMLLGWSLQAPVSGLAAWILILLKRPFRPSDRIQFPALDLTGDVQDIGAMYITLNQVGGSIASEEAVGRRILFPNAMLFQQVVINYTVVPDAPYMLDEVVIRITYDSSWEQAEKILLNAAWEVTRDIIEATGEHPYIRSELYDYGVYLRLRYQTRVKDRAETAYEIEKKVFEEIQRDPTVDIAIPYVYSYRAVMDGRAEIVGDRDMDDVKEIQMSQIHTDSQYADDQDISQLARSIEAHGLFQPVVVIKDLQDDRYNLLSGHLRFAACKKLGWKKIPALIREDVAD
jgi:small-conductance mechanosensitive channel